MIRIYSYLLIFIVLLDVQLVISTKVTKVKRFYEDYRQGTRHKRAVITFPEGSNFVVS